MGKVVIIMGSKSDLEHCEKIVNVLNRFGIRYSLRVSSAHKTPDKVLQIIKNFETDDVVFITVAGKSNALSGFVDAQTTRPVIACPPYSNRFGGADVFSSLRMPSGVCPMTVLEPEGAALAAIKILGVGDKSLQAKIKEYQEEKRKEIEVADRQMMQDKEDRP